MEAKESLKLFLSEIGKFKLLSKEEEFELSRQILEEGSEAARDKLVKHNMRLVVSIAKKPKSSKGSLVLEDLIQYGVLGLIIAANKYDYKRGNRFSTYATWWIRQAVYRSILDKSETIRIPVHFQESAIRLRDKILDLERRFKRNPTTGEIIEFSEFSAEFIEWYMAGMRNVSSLYYIAKGYDGDFSAIVDFIEDENAVDPEMALIISSRNDKIEEALSFLKERDRDIIKKRFGIGRKGSMTLDKIGKEYGVSRERIRQIEAKAIKSLKRRMLRNYSDLEE
ncbi:RNA polymerase sigma factor RpoD/SigA [Patescibacteria group bacterium]